MTLIKRFINHQVESTAPTAVKPGDNLVPPGYDQLFLQGIEGKTQFFGPPGNIVLLDDLGIFLNNPAGFLGPFQSCLHHRQEILPGGFGGTVRPAAHVIIGLPGLKT